MPLSTTRRAQSRVQEPELEGLEEALELREEEEEEPIGVHTPLGVLLAVSHTKLDSPYAVPPTSTPGPRRSSGAVPQTRSPYSVSGVVATSERLHVVAAVCTSHVGEYVGAVVGGDVGIVCVLDVALVIVVEDPVCVVVEDPVVVVEVTVVVVEVTVSVEETVPVVLETVEEVIVVAVGAPLGAWVGAALPLYVPSV